MVMCIHFDRFQFPDRMEPREGGSLHFGSMKRDFPPSFLAPHVPCSIYYSIEVEIKVGPLRRNKR
jgi:hypothetical protein